MDQEKLLEGEKAINLWLQGKKAWNTWVKENPSVNVSFQDVDFFRDVDIQKKQKKVINFSYFDFPGSVNFIGANFGNVSVDFSNAKFGKGEVNFLGAKFNGRNVDFSGAIFGEGNVNFSEVIFCGEHVNFSNAIFVNGDVDFKATNFGKAGVCFFKANFCEGKVDFSNANFGDGSVNFSDVTFGGRDVDFSYAVFGQHADFSLLNISSETKQFSFRYAVFNGSLAFSTSFEIRLIPCFVGTKTTNHVSFSALKYRLPTKEMGVFNKAINGNDAENLCRLKEIAENNKEYVTALRFHADEMRAKRWQKGKQWPASLLDLLFDFFSLYGQSIWRPLAGLLLTILTSVLYTVGFPLFSPSAYAQWFNISDQRWVHGFEIALSRAIPFLGGVRIDGQSAMKTEVIKELLPVHFNIVSAGFSLCAFAFIFLIGLGLRNRFRL